MILSLDGPAVSSSQSISTSVEVKVGGTALDERKMISVQPLDGNVFLSYNTPATSANGFMKIFQGQYVEVERGNTLPVYIIAETGTVETLIGEIG